MLFLTTTFMGRLKYARAGLLYTMKLSWYQFTLDYYKVRILIAMPMITTKKISKNIHKGK
jgi:hypothetical protein